ncbi:FAD-dependent oxidoreductase [Micromonospora sp. NPDC049559]|uniref:NAD(P)/FAD-dependent oxidoreductase n=1 Tax=Micromonospora sp. NPDC049559 TaxID=3155923 RepID=UPI003436E7D7
MTRVVVLGAGYAGLVAAKLAARRTRAEVTLVNAGDRFVERVRLHQLAAGQRLRDLPLTELLAGTDVNLVVGLVTEIDTARRVVRLDGAAQRLQYDVLVYALGSAADLTSVPGAAEHAHAVADAGQARRLRDRVRDGTTVAVVGGGLTGIETAAELAESYPGAKVRMVTGGVPGAALSAKARRHFLRTFHRLGIELRENVRVTEVHADGLSLAGGERLDADIVVWTTGFRVSSLAAEAGLAVDGHGRMLVDDTLRSVSHPEVYGIGDSAAARLPSGQELRMACATAIPSAACAVRAIAARLAGREARPLNFRYVTQCVSLGRRDGLIQFVRPDDTPARGLLTGRPAALYKEAIVRAAYWSQRHPGLTAAM